MRFKRSKKKNKLSEKRKSDKSVQAISNDKLGKCSTSFVPGSSKHSEVAQFKLKMSVNPFEQPGADELHRQSESSEQLKQGKESEQSKQQEECDKQLQQRQQGQECKETKEHKPREEPPKFIDLKNLCEHKLKAKKQFTHLPVDCPLAFDARRSNENDLKCDECAVLEDLLASKCEQCLCAQELASQVSRKSPEPGSNSWSKSLSLKKKQAPTLPFDSRPSSLPRTKTVAELFNCPPTKASVPRKDPDQERDGGQLFCNDSKKVDEAQENKTSVSSHSICSKPQIFKREPSRKVFPGSNVYVIQPTFKQSIHPTSPQVSTGVQCERLRARSASRNRSPPLQTEKEDAIKKEENDCSGESYLEIASSTDQKISGSECWTDLEAGKKESEEKNLKAQGVDSPKKRCVLIQCNLSKKRLKSKSASDRTSQHKKRSKSASPAKTKPKHDADLSKTSLPEVCLASSDSELSIRSKDYLVSSRSTKSGGLPESDTEIVVEEKIYVKCPADKFRRKKIYSGNKSILTGKSLASDIRLLLCDRRALLSDEPASVKDEFIKEEDNLSSDQKYPSPDRRSIASCDKSSSPDNKSPSPDRKSMASCEKSLSPDRKSPSPDRKSPSPDRRSIASSEKSPSPDKKSVCSDDKVESPEGSLCQLSAISKPSGKRSVRYDLKSDHSNEGTDCTSYQSNDSDGKCVCFDETSIGPFKSTSDIEKNNSSQSEDVQQSRSDFCSHFRDSKKYAGSHFEEDRTATLSDRESTFYSASEIDSSACQTLVTSSMTSHGHGSDTNPYAYLSEPIDIEATKKLMKSASKSQSIDSRASRTTITYKIIDMSRITCIFIVLIIFILVFFFAMLAWRIVRDAK